MDLKAHGWMDDDDVGWQCLTCVLFFFLSFFWCQALERISKFVHSTVLPGAADEIGVLCFNIVSAHPEESVTRLLVPLMESIVSSLAESPSTGFSGSGVRTSGADFKVNSNNPSCPNPHKKQCQ